MWNLVLNKLSGGLYSRTTLNDNFEKIESAVDGQLNRYPSDFTGVPQGNAMHTELDMNSNLIINYTKEPVDPYDLVNKLYVDAEIEEVYSYIDAEIEEVYSAIGGGTGTTITTSVVASSDYVASVVYPKEPLSLSKTTAAESWCKGGLYSGNSSTQTVTVKDFDSATLFIAGTGLYAGIFDSEYPSGFGVQVDSNSNLEDFSGSFGGFTSNGFSLNSDSEFNSSLYDYFYLMFTTNHTVNTVDSEGDPVTIKSNAEAGFSKVLFTRNGSLAQKIPHGLPRKPSLIIHRNLTNPVVETSWEFLGNLNEFNGETLLSEVSKDANFRDDYFLITSGNSGTDSSLGLNTEGDSFVSNCFCEIEGVSNFRKYYGKVNSDDKVRVPVDIDVENKRTFVYVTGGIGSSFFTNDETVGLLNSDTPSFGFGTTNTDVQEVIFGEGYIEFVFDGSPKFNSLEDSFIVWAFTEEYLEATSLVETDITASVATGRDSTGSISSENKKVTYSSDFSNLNTGKQYIGYDFESNQEVITDIRPSYPADLANHRDCRLVPGNIAPPFSSKLSTSFGSIIPSNVTENLSSTSAGYLLSDNILNVFDFENSGDYVEYETVDKQLPKALKFVCDKEGITSFEVKIFDYGANTWVTTVTENSVAYTAGNSPIYQINPNNLVTDRIRFVATNVVLGDSGVRSLELSYSPTVPGKYTYDSDSNYFKDGNGVNKEVVFFGEASVVETATGNTVVRVVNNPLRKYIENISVSGTINNIPVEKFSESICKAFATWGAVDGLISGSNILGVVNLTDALSNKYHMVFFDEPMESVDYHVDFSITDNTLNTLSVRILEKSLTYFKFAIVEDGVFEWSSKGSLRVYGGNIE